MKPSWCALLPLSLALAQERPPVAEDLAVALRGDDPITVAWAAHDARQRGDKAAIPALQATLLAWRDNDRPGAPRVRLFVTDALLGLDARLPAEDLVPLLEDASCGNAVLVLLLREPRVNERQILTAFTGRAWPRRSTEFHDEHYRTVALGNVLCRQRTPGFAALVWQRLDLRLHVTVPDPAAPATAGFFSVTRDRGRSKWLNSRYPPRVQHELSIGPTEAPHRELAPGPLPIRHLRRETPEDPGTSSFRATIDGHAWLRELSSKAPAETLRLPVVPFVDAESWRRDVTAARDGLRQACEACLADLTATGAMTQAEAAKARADLQVTVVVHDAVHDRRPPLPKID